MAWIESHQAIERHPKTLHLAAGMGWDLDTTIGKLHRFWWWVMEYAEDGNLSKFDDSVLAGAAGVIGEDDSTFVDCMVQAGFLDIGAHLRVHDWWQYFGRFLQVKYKSKPEKWRAIQHYYSEESGFYNPPNNSCNNHIPNLTKPNLTKPTKPTSSAAAKKASPPLDVALFDEFWSIWPKKVAKRDAEKAWKKLAPDAALFEAIKAGIRLWSNNWAWQKDGGQFIPNPATFLNGRRWEDEPPMATVKAPNGHPQDRDIEDIRVAALEERSRRIIEDARNARVGAISAKEWKAMQGAE